MYTDINFKTKKQLKEAVATRVAFLADMESCPQGHSPRPITYYQPNGDLTGTTPPLDGYIALEGPHYPKPHRWYAQATVKNGEVIAVK